MDDRGTQCHPAWMPVIARFPRRLMQGRRDQPLVLADARAELPCGCAGWVGVRTDTAKSVAVIRPCSDAHDRLCQVAQDALIESLKRPGAALNVELVDELLVETGRILA